MTITFLITALLAMCLLAAVVWFAIWLIGLGKFPEPIGRILTIIVVILALVALISYLFPGVLPI